jgi:hypothetical protein
MSFVCSRRSTTGRLAPGVLTFSVLLVGAVGCSSPSEPCTTGGPTVVDATDITEFGGILTIQRDPDDFKHVLVVTEADGHRLAELDAGSVVSLAFLQDGFGVKEYVVTADVVLLGFSREDDMARASCYLLNGTSTWEVDAVVVGEIEGDL